VKTRDYSPDPRTGVKISAFPAPLEDRKLTLPSPSSPISVEFVTGTRVLAFASEAVPNAVRPESNLGQFTDQSGLYYLNARYYDGASAPRVCCIER
jgi:hypothetical protein